MQRSSVVRPLCYPQSFPTFRSGRSRPCAALGLLLGLALVTLAGPTGTRKISKQGIHMFVKKAWKYKYRYKYINLSLNININISINISRNRNVNINRNKNISININTNTNSNININKKLHIDI